MKKPKIKPVIEDKNSPSTHRIVLLNEIFQKEEDIPSEVKDIIKENEGELVNNFKIEMNYDNMSIEQVLREIIPPEIDHIPSSFEVVGHLVHLNLKDHFLPYQHQIGQVIVDKLPNIRTVVNKSSNIETKFRTFPMDLIAGEKDYNVEVSQSNCRFRFNFEDVYWNSRLQSEHERIVSLCKKGDIIVDMFAGVGPFSIPLAKKGCFVHANDLNPYSYKYLVDNAKRNKVEENHISYNMDGREFIRQMNADNVLFTDVIMNLPASAIEFLDVFSELDWSYMEGRVYPTIHCYGFTKAEDHNKDIIERIRTVLGKNTIEEKFHEVRNVSPKKWMICASFKIDSFFHGSNKKRKMNGEE